MIIDFHTHCFTDSVAKKAIPALEERSGVKTAHAGTLSSLRQHMAQSGVDRFVVQPVATKPPQVQTIIQWAKENEDEQAVFFGALHPDDEDLLQAAQQLKDLGFKGVKLHGDYQGFFADEERMMPLYAALRDLGMILLLHAGVDIGMPNLVHCTPLMIANIHRRIPGLKLVAAHMGSHGLWRDAEDLLVGKDVYFDTSYSYYKLGRENMARMIRDHGTDKVLFGTDSPWKDAGEAVDQIASLCLTASDTDRIFCENALSLLE